MSVSNSLFCPWSAPSSLANPHPSRNCKESFFPNHPQHSWCFQLPYLEMLTSVLGLAHLVPGHPCGLPSQTQLSQTHRCSAVPSVQQALIAQEANVGDTQRSSFNHFGYPRNSFFGAVLKMRPKTLFKIRQDQNIRELKAYDEVAQLLGFFPVAVVKEVTYFPQKKHE